MVCNGRNSLSSYILVILTRLWRTSVFGWYPMPPLELPRTAFTTFILDVLLLFAVSYILCLASCILDVVRKL